MTANETWMLLFCFSLGVNCVLVMYLLRSGRPARKYRPTACRRCGYDTRATIGGRCPECGEPVATRSPTRGITHCNYCGRSNRDTGGQIEGPDAFICANCVV